MDKLTEIKKVMSEATSGPWIGVPDAVRDSKTGEWICQMYGEHQDGGDSEEEYLNAEHNAEFIAKSPEYITYLLQLVEKTQAERFEYEKLAADNQAETSRLARVLEWYADNLNWNQGNWHGKVFFTLAEDDGGLRAREALSHIESNS